MQQCHNCQSVIDEYTLDKQLDGLRELTVDDFNLCADCVTVVDDACVTCGGAVYVPESATKPPHYCPACRADLLAGGHDPGWRSDVVSD
ncbi:hypothetical protein KI372_11125 [Halobacterium salinarum]|nr:hypothetical protein [Halobacterium salinarum]